MKADTLKVPGASLYHEVTGSGPVLLMIPGGAADASGFAGLAGLLADQYTVVACDARGTSRSELAGPVDYPLLEAMADDIHRMLAAFGTAPAYVLTSSGGALAALDVVGRHPDQVRTLVVHEPPITELLPDAAQHRAMGKEIHETYRRDGIEAAMQKFMASAGFDEGDEPAGPPQGEMSPEALAAMARMQANMEFMVGHMFPAFDGYLPDFAALRATSTRIVVGIGESSTGQVAHEAGVALAKRLGDDPVTFPGDHGGFGSHPAEFAEVLRKVLAAG